MSNEIKTTPGYIRAKIASKTFDKDGRTFEVTWSTGYKGKRYSWSRGEYYESLSLEKNNVRLKRLNNRAPFLDAHRSWELRSVIGVVKKAWIEDEGDSKKGKAVIQLSVRESLDDIARDIQDGILNHVSVGYAVNKYEEQEDGGKIPHYRAVDWEPYEISLVPAGFDDKAQVRSNDENFRMTIIERSKKDMPEDIPNKNPDSGENNDDVKREKSPVVPEKTEEEIRTEVNKHNMEIRLAVRKAGLGEEFADDIISRGLTRADSFLEIINRYKKDGEKTPEQRSQNSKPNIGIGDQDETQTRLEAVAEQILNRADPAMFKITEKSRKYAGLRLVEMAREVLRWNGKKVEGMYPMQLARSVLSTSDFVFILEDIQNKTLRESYKMKAQTFEPFVRRVQNADFKEISRTQLGETPKLKKIGEDGEIKYGSIPESAEKYNVATYGAGSAITRKTIINDDLNAFVRLPRAFGMQAKRLESDLVWTAILSNPVMADGFNLFSAQHNNLAAGGDVGAISVDSVGLAIQAMMSHTGLDGETEIEIEPEHLVFPIALATVGYKFLDPRLIQNQVDEANPWMSMLKPVKEIRLDRNSLDAWYVFSSLKTSADMVELCTLEGIPGPVVEVFRESGVDGLKVQIVYDVGAKVIEWRTFYKNPGA